MENRPGGVAGGGYSFWDCCRVCGREVGGCEIGVKDLLLKAEGISADALIIILRGL